MCRSLVIPNRHLSYPQVRAREHIFAEGGVKDIDPRNGRCMVRNVSPARGVVYSHCAPIAVLESGSGDSLVCTMAREA